MNFKINLAALYYGFLYIQSNFNYHCVCLLVYVYGLPYRKRHILKGSLGISLKVYI
jgi:hypothetical protein